MTIENYTGLYGTMQDYAECMTIQHHYKIGCSTIRDIARHNYRGLCSRAGWKSKKLESQ